MMPSAYTQFTKENADEADLFFKSYRAYSRTDLEKNDSEAAKDSGVQRAKISDLATYRAGAL